MNQNDFDFDPMSLVTAPDSGGVFELLDDKGTIVFIGTSADVRLALLRIYGDESGKYAKIHDKKPVKAITYTPFYQDDRLAFAHALVRAKKPSVAKV